VSSLAVFACTPSLIAQPSRFGRALERVPDERTTEDDDPGLKGATRLPDTATPQGTDGRATA
ncbi:MAG TPA: hypothetical protein VIW46_04945, partial [Acidimicrobiia bacterium]